MAYTPSTFHYTINDMNVRVYDDKHIQVTYINLRTLSKLIYSLRQQAQIDLQDAIDNVGVHAVKDQTFQILGMFASKILEGISAFWTAGTAPAWISMIIGKIASGVITKLIEQSQPGDEIQSKANEIREGMLAIFDATKKKIDQMVVDPERHWTEVFHCEDYSNLGIKGDITMADMAEGLDFFPDEENPDYDDFLLYLSQRCKSVIVSQLLPVKWQVKRYPTYWVKDYYLKDSGQHFDFDYEQYNPHIDDYYWCQKFDGYHEKPFPAYYFIGTQTDAHTSVNFLNFIKEISTTDMNEHSSFWGYLEYVDNLPDGDRYYYGANVHTFLLTDKDGNKAPTILSNWLFQDDVYNNVTKKYAVATREEVYTKWAL